MTEDRAKELVDKHIRRLYKELGICPDINVHVYYKSKHETCVDAQMQTDIDSIETYREAYITVFFEGLKDDEEFFIKCLVHELLHIQLAPMQIVFDVWNRLLPKKQQKAFSKLFHHALERTVSGIEIGLNEGTLKNSNIQATKKSKSNGKH